MKNQKGAALVIVLALLAGSLMIGISGMNSALIDERLAGNYRASALAQMAAEDVAGYIRQALNENAEPPKDPSHIEEEVEGWDIFDSEQAGFPDNVDEDDNIIVELRRSFFSCDTTTSEADNAVACDQIYDYDDGAWQTSNPLENPFYISRGQVVDRDDGGVVATHLVVVAPVKGAPSGFFADLGDFEGKSVIAGEDEESCGKNNRDTIESCEILGEGNVPRPDNVIDDFISNYENGGIPAEQVVESCDGGFSRKESQKYVLCMGESFEGKIGDNLDGMTVIVSGERKEGGEFEGGSVEDVNVKSSIAISFIARGDIKLKGFGNNILTGNFWSGGNVELGGGPNITGGIAAFEKVDFDGKANVSGGLEIDGGVGGGGNQGYIWLPL